ncbi:P-loop NTPase domain-containing protein (plasmid) [Rhizobium gallicum bv. gallicum R602sp]|uniref:p-loop NTPase domain-containing protein n=2 Tax=Rhizobium TaxID=379 RepID=A0A0B4XHJ8_9HYPH|nr:P-loop NTPase domain-containing protein [Rhizobium gallicum bv. gallicum R602sp]
MHWEPGRVGIARGRVLRDKRATGAAQADSWIMEGVYGQLVNMVLDRVTTLIWIDLPEEECVESFKERGIQGGETRTQFDDLLKWVAEYRIRTNNWNSFQVHGRLFAEFSGPKLLLSNRQAVTEFAETLTVCVGEAIDE